jgi:hypothetical protein
VINNHSGQDIKCAQDGASFASSGSEDDRKNREC